MAIKPLVEKIRELRKELGMNQRQFAECYGIPKRTVEGWESNYKADKPADWAAKLLIRDMDARLNGDTQYNASIFRAYLNSVSARLEDEAGTPEAEAQKELLAAVKESFNTLFEY